MPDAREVDEIICKYFPPPPQPSDSMDDLVEWERRQARKVVRDVLALTLRDAARLPKEDFDGPCVDLST